MANLLIDKALTSAYTVTGSWADITDMSQMVTVAGTGSVVILMMTLAPEMTNTDETAEYRFTHDGSPVGPILTAYADAIDEGSSRAMMFALTGLSAGSHTFAVQANKVWNTAVIDTGFTRTFQCIEIESGASLLVDKATSVSNTAPATYANMTNLSDVQTPSSGSTLLFIAGTQITDAADAVCRHQFAIDGSRFGPEVNQVTDAIIAATGCAMAWAETGVSAASHTFSLQWKIQRGSPTMDTTRQRTFQVIEFTANADLLIDKESTAAASSTGSYADIVDMNGSPDIDGTGSIVLLLCCSQILMDSDETATYCFSIGGTQEGAEPTYWTDSPNDRTDHAFMAHAATGESGVTSMSCQWITRKASPAIDTGVTRTFQVLDLKVAAVGANPKGPFGGPFVGPFGGPIC